MGSDTPPIARIRLARSLPRLLAWPIVLLALAAAAAVAGVLVGATGGIALLAGSALVALLALGWAARVLSVRLDIEESEVRVHWIGGERRYVLSAGPVTRVRFRGENASRLRVRSGILGYGLGAARLREDEEIHVVRLAPTPTAILVPTEEGRLAIAPADEGELLEALSRAARARQRLDTIAQRTGDAAREAGAAGLTTDEPEPSTAAITAAAPPTPPIQPAEADGGEPDARPMTGIERMLYERRLAEERAAAEAAAEAALAALAEAEQAAADAGTEAGMPAPSPAPEAVPVVAATSARERPRLRRLPRLRVGRAQARHAVALVPLAGALVAWGIGIVGDRMPDPTTDLGRLTALGLVLAGPGTALGVLVARAWWPRLIGVVVVGGLATSALIGRVLIGA